MSKNKFSVIDAEILKAEIIKKIENDCIYEINENKEYTQKKLEKLFVSMTQTNDRLEALDTVI